MGSKILGMCSKTLWMGSSLPQKWEREEKPTEKGQGSRRFPQNPAATVLPAGRRRGDTLGWDWSGLSQTKAS